MLKLRNEITRYIRAGYALDLVLGLTYLIDALLAHPFPRFSRFVDLDGEANLPTWFSSMQLFCIAALLWVFATRAIRRSSRTSWLLGLLPAVFLLFSLDEVAQLHESMGGLLDRLVLVMPRALSPLPKTGVFFLFFGIPFTIAFAILIIALRPYLRRSRGAFAKIASGSAVMLVAAVGIEALSNLAVDGTFLASVQVFVEEVGELVGATTIVWGCYELVRDSA